MDYASLKNNRKHTKKFFCEWEIPKRTSLAHKKNYGEKEEDNRDKHQFIVPWQMR